MKLWTLLVGTMAAMAACLQTALAQHSSVPPRVTSHIIVPQTRGFGPAVGGVEVSFVIVSIDISEQVATTTMDVELANRTGTRQESQMIVPVPDRAVLRGFTFQGSALEPKAELLAHDEARRIYDSIVTSTRDPALLEFLGCNLIRSSVFPVEPRSGQKVRIIYEHLLSRDGDRVDFVLPRTESIDYRVAWNIARSANQIELKYRQHCRRLAVSIRRRHRWRHHRPVRPRRKTPDEHLARPTLVHSARHVRAWLADEAFDFRAD